MFNNTNCNGNGGVTEMWLINKEDLHPIEVDGNCIVTKLTIKRKYGKRKREIFYGRNTSK